MVRPVDGRRRKRGVRRLQILRIDPTIHLLLNEAGRLMMLGLISERAQICALKPLVHPYTKEYLGFVRKVWK